MYNYLKYDPSCGPIADCTTGPWDISYSSCEICATGKFYDQSTSTECKNCAGGKYKDAPGQSECQNCSSHNCVNGDHTKCICLPVQGTEDGSTTNCTDCGVGKYSSSQTGQCQGCHEGTFTNTTGNSECHVCPGGQYTLATGASEYTTCSSGKYSVPTFSHCSTCPGGKYSGSGASECTACPAGKYSDEGSSTCVDFHAACTAPSGSPAYPTGYTWDGSANVCYDNTGLTSCDNWCGFSEILCGGCSSNYKKCSDTHSHTNVAFACRLQLEYLLASTRCIVSAHPWSGRFGRN